MKYETVAKALAIIMFAMITAYMGWLTSTVFSLDKKVDTLADTKEMMGKFRDWNIKQGEEIKALDKRMDNLEAPERTH